MKNIFENAYFGKAYKTRDGNKAVLISLSDFAVLSMSLDNPPYITSINITCGMDGKNIDKFLTDKQDIVSEWEEKINKEELDKLANNYRCESFTTPVTDGQNIDTYIESMDVSEYIYICEISFKDGFKAGYNFAKKGE